MNPTSGLSTALIGLALTCATALPALAGDRVMFANLADDPDSLWVSDIDNTAQGHNTLATPVDFLRGLVLDGEQSGWFIASYTEIGGPTGFYRFDNGTLTKVAEFPLTKTGSLADATLEPGRAFLYYVFNPAGPQGYTLYRVGFDGTFTEIGELSDASEPDPMVPAIAVHPVTGVLYGYENRTVPRLVTIDPTTAVMTPVGPSGLPPYPQRVMMSMDFTQAGELILAENFGILYRVDVATGQASTPFAQLLFPTGAIAFLPEDDPLGTPYCSSSVNSSGAAATISASGSASIAANDLVLEASTLPVGVPGLFLYGGAPTQVPFGNGTLCVGAGAVGVFRLPVEVSDASGSLVHGLDNTAPPSAAGQLTPGSTWYFQAWFRDPAAGGASFDLSDGLELVCTP